METDRFFNLGVDPRRPPKGRTWIKELDPRDFPRKQLLWAKRQINFSRVNSIPEVPPNRVFKF